MSTKIYKKGQATLTRLIAAVIVVLLLGWGSYALFAGIYAENWTSSSIVSIPGVGLSITPAFLIALGVFVGGGIILFRVLNRPNLVDLFIDTEVEMKKVSWPTRAEAWSSSMIVIVVTMIITVMLFVFDLVLNQFFSLVFGE